MQYLNTLKQWIATPKAAIIVSTTFAALTLVRLWARGGTCRVDRDLTGQIVVVTGGNTGIGKEAIRELAKRHCTIYFGARDSRKSEEAIKQILKENKQAKIIFFPLDLADKQSITEFANKIKEQVGRIDILINNAGVGLIKERRETNDGFQLQMGINHLGHFYLTHLLWDQLKQSNEFRIINVSSRAHNNRKIWNYYPTIDFEDIHYTKNYKYGESYGRSKAANILFTRELQKRIDQAGLPGTAVSLHPGVVRTEFFQRTGSWAASVLKTILSPLAYLVMKSPNEGAQTTIHLALEKKDKLEKGEYYVDCKVSPSSPFTSSIENAEKLWKVSQRELGIEFDV